MVWLDEKFSDLDSTALTGIDNIGCSRFFPAVGAMRRFLIHRHFFPPSHFRNLVQVQETSCAFAGEKALRFSCFRRDERPFAPT
jgi:hypothetical protein